MAFRRRARRAPRKLRRKGKGARRGRVPRSLNPMNQRATIIETIVVPYAAVADAQIGINIFDISQFGRALQCSTLYKWYKADWCEWEYQPRYNLYSQGNAGGSTIPYMYHAMNRTQDASLPPALGQCAQFMASQGAIPKKFTSKITLRYKPNWCSPGLIAQRLDVNNQNVTAVAQMGLKPQYGWVASPDNAFTSGGVNTVMPIASPATPVPAPNGYTAVANFPAAVQYNGHYSWFDVNGTESFSVGDIVLRVKWSFKNPGYFALGPRVSDVSGNYV